MDSVKKTLFEDPFTVYLVLVLVEVVLVGLWYGQRKKAYLAWMLAPAVLAAGAWWLERAVVTDREQILAALDEIARAAERHDTDTLAGYLDEDYRGWGVRKIGAVALAKAATLKWRVRKVTFLGTPEIDVRGKDQADATIWMMVGYTGGLGEGNYPLGWRAEWVKRPDGWKVRRATLMDNPTP